jgi:hypothetical protein
MKDELRYLYAVTGAGASAAIDSSGLRGIDGGRIEPVVEGELLGATSAVPAADYDEAPLNEHLQDLDWLAPRAAAHQEVNARLLELAGAVVPLAFGAIYRGTDGVRALLRSRADDLAERLGRLAGRAEWIVSIEREDPTPSNSPALQALESAIAAAPPGRAFLLGKRRDEVVREERRIRDAAIANEAAAAVEGIADDLYREPLIDDAAVSAVARFSVLLRRAREVELGDVVRRLGASDASNGYRVRLSGPWPAYRFGGLSSERVTSA